MPGAYTMAVNTSVVIEATSLQSVTNIAAHPPLDPSTPPPHDAYPLVLYIARVPGSRDVFLTPMKPRDKVVSAEDVQSCLYFVHVNIDDNDLDANQAALARDLDASNDRRIEPVVASRSQLPTRRPVPSASSACQPGEGPSSTLPPRNPPAVSHTRIARKPVATIQPQSDYSHQVLPNLPVLPPRPLPSPPAESYSRGPVHMDSVEHLLQSDLGTSTPAGTLTLIRRDPGSGAQWNVAAIHDPAVPEISSASLRAPTAALRTKKGGAPLYLDISNPGYAPFAALDMTTPACASGDGDAWPAPRGTFRRRLYLPGSRHGEHGYTAAPQHLQQRRKHTSIASLSSLDLERGTDDAPPRADRRGRSYTFASPWSGICELDSGVMGRSLKCRHTLPMGVRSTASAQRWLEEDVSELRFNLPPSVRGAGSEDGASGRWKKRAAHFAPHQRTWSADGQEPDKNGTRSFCDGAAADMDTGRIDLSLGQERAGGGFGGSQAKLGKLIVQPAGLKMLDLLVAANVGLWWRAYERA